VAEKHVQEGDLHLFLDQEATPAQVAEVKQHLEVCTECRSRLEMLTHRSQYASQHLDLLQPGRMDAPVSVPVARARIEEMFLRKEGYSMWKKMFQPRFRTAWIGFALVVIVAIAMSFAPVRAIASSFLGLFRVQRVTIVQVDPGNLPQLLGSSSSLETLFAEDIQTERLGETVTVQSATEASQLVGFPARLPWTGGDQTQLDVFPGTQVSMKVDLKKARAILEEVGRSDIELPDTLDGATVTVDVPAMFAASFGDCPEESLNSPQMGGFDPNDPDDQGRTPTQCTTLIQMKSPEIDAPPGLDINRLGQAYLQLMGLSPEEAAHFSQNIDWATTLVVPIPREGTTYQDFNVDGVTGVLITQSNTDPYKRYLLIWVKDGILYILGGPGNANAAASIANTLK